MSSEIMVEVQFASVIDGEKVVYSDHRGHYVGHKVALNEAGGAHMCLMTPQGRVFIQGDSIVGVHRDRDKLP